MKPRAMKKKPVAMKRGGKKMMRGGMAKKPMAMKRGGSSKATAGPKSFTKKGSGKTTRPKPAKSKMQMLKDAAKKAGKKLF
tara:strand:- start:2467 stop:2709 length:243 start_codon:yes stop_codon:yes gene_type:complete